MPRTVSFPPPSATTCPICGTGLDQPACPRCGAVFATEDGATLWKVDHDLFDLCRIRNDVVRRLLATAEHARATAAATPAPPPAASAPAPGTDPAPAPAGPAGTMSPLAPGPVAPGRGGPVTGPALAPGLTATSEVGTHPTGAAAPTGHGGTGPADTASGDGSPWAPPVAARSATPTVAPRPADPAAAGAPVSPPPMRPPAEAGAAPSGPRFTIAEVLVGLGALSLVAAVVVFAAVTWSDLAAWAQGGLIVGATGIVATLAAVTRRRGLVATAESLGAVTVALALADVHVARVGLSTPSRPTWATGLAVVSVATVLLGARWRVRSAALAGVALAFVPLPLLLAEPGPVPLAVGLAGQALLALAARDRSGGRLERAVTAVGAAGSWALAVGIGVVAALAGMADDPGSHPVGAAALLAALAVGSLVVSRRADDGSAAVLGAAGALLAFVPAPLLVTAEGSATDLATVLVVQAAVAAAVLTLEHLRAAERAAVTAAALTTGGTGALAAVAVGLVALFEEGVPVAGSALLAGLSLSWLVAAHRPDDDRLAGLGGPAAVLAFAPAPFLALGSGSPAVVAAVVAAEGLVALAVAGIDRLRPSAAGVLDGLAPLALVLGTGAAVVMAANAVVTGSLDDRLVPLVTVAAVAAGLVTLGRATDRSGRTATGTSLALVPAPLLVAGLGSTSVLVWTLGAQVAVAVLVASRTRGAVARALDLGAAASWALAVAAATTMGVAGWATTPDRHPAGAVAALVVLALATGGASQVRRWDRERTGTALAAGAVPLLVAAGLVAGGAGPDGRIAAVLAGAAFVGLGATVLRRVDPVRPWLAPQLTALAVGAVAGVVPVLTGVDVVALLVDRAVADPGVGADVVVADWVRPALGASEVLPGRVAVGQLTALAVLAGVLATWRHRAGLAAGVTVALAALAVVPVVAGLTVQATLSGLAAVLVATAEALRRHSAGRGSVPGAGEARHHQLSPELLAGFAGVAALGLAVARASEPAVVAWTALVTTLLVGLTALRARALDRDTPVWAAASGTALLSTVALDTASLGASTDQTALTFAVVALGLAVVAHPLERRGAPGRAAATVVDATAAVAAGLGLLVGPGAPAASAVLLLAACAAAVTALRPARRPAAALAGALAVLALWVQLGHADVALVEAYTLPLATLAGGIGTVVGRNRGSWERFGVGLLVALGPSTMLALADPDPLRAVAVVLAGAACVVWGATRWLQAPLAVGGSAVAVVAVRHLAPVAAELPRSAALAAVGLVLLAVGATFEQRRRDLRQARESFGRLG